MGDARILIYSAIGFVAGLVLFFKGFSWHKRKRLIQNIPTSKIRSIAMGLVEIYGSVHPVKKKILKSPFSNKDCVYYRYTIERYQKRGKHSSWVKIKSSDDRIPFNLKDNTGTVMVDPKSANIDIPMDNEFRSSTGRNPSAQVTKFIKSIGVGYEGFLGFNHKMRYREYFIAPNDKLYILGTAGDNPHVADATAQKNEEDIMIQKGKNSKIYYISDRHESAILNSLGWKSTLGIYGGALLSLGCLIAILLYFGLF